MTDQELFTYAEEITEILACHFERTVFVKLGRCRDAYQKWLKLYDERGERVAQITYGQRMLRYAAEGFTEYYESVKRFVERGDRDAYPAQGRRGVAELVAHEFAHVLQTDSVRGKVHTIGFCCALWDVRMALKLMEIL